ncbi:hypothetical protein OCF65_20960 [Bacillus toyonensis]|nr:MULTISPECIES: hypothetical protein [Bacillus cereus group]EJV49163.1 hypothetical protein IEK_02873 [Bacillus toyonensis]MCU4767319.1 hypothetical protein [Bacillus toyonensis]MCU5582909.1 hypothetical protein [Bacillus toyonensis]MED2847023.1 hypothetical protein [Bacillus toyonensis]MED3087887.1 hypothetical protein [Bacillus toyonensis]
MDPEASEILGILDVYEESKREIFEMIEAEGMAHIKLDTYNMENN